MWATPNSANFHPISSHLISWCWKAANCCTNAACVSAVSASVFLQRRVPAAWKLLHAVRVAAWAAAWSVGWLEAPWFEFWISWTVGRYIFILTVAPLCPLTRRTIDIQVQSGATTSLEAAGVLFARLDTHVRHLLIRPFPWDDVGESEQCSTSCRLLISFHSLSLSDLLPLAVSKKQVCITREESRRGPSRFQLVKTGSSGTEEICFSRLQKKVICTKHECVSKCLVFNSLTIKYTYLLEDQDQC